MSDNIYINGFKLILTCRACPEQYDVFDPAGTLVAYFRLRHGRFTANCPDVGGEIVYTAYPLGDGHFVSTERAKYLREAIHSVEDYYISSYFVNNSDDF